MKGAVIILDYNVTLFYKTHFVIEATSAVDDLLWFVVNKIPQWIAKSRKLNYSDVFKMYDWSQFKHYGEFSLFEDSIYGQSTSFKEQLESGFLTYWATEIKETQNQPGYSPRTWKTEIGYMPINNSSAIFSLVVSYYNLSGFIGETLDTPSPTTHRIVRWMLESKEIKCWAGSTQLDSLPHELRTGDYPQFHEVVFDKSRGTPVILISPGASSFLNDEQEVESFEKELARNTMGNAIIYYSTQRGFIEELDYLIDDRYTCYEGSIRIYYPELDLNDPNDGYRHRYITKSQIEAWGKEKLIKILRNALSQSIRGNEIDRLFCIENCNKLYQRYKHQELRTEFKKVSESEFSYVEQAEKYYDKCERLLREKDTLNNDLSKLEKENYNLKMQISNSAVMYTEAQNLKSALSGRNAIGIFPGSPIQIGEYFENVFSDRIAFTDRGKRSLHECETKPNILWSCLFSIANDLYPLFKDKCETLEKTFGDNSSFELALNEGKQTHADKKLMALRVDYYNGQQINIEKHVKKKSGTPENSIRVYFDYSKNLEKIIIGSCGLHLNNYSTRKLR